MLKDTTWFLITFWMLISNAVADSPKGAHVNPEVIICPSQGQTTEMPNFTEANCQNVVFYATDPVNRQLWLKAQIELSSEILEQEAPLGIFISGKAASEVHLNGVKVGQNGQPSDHSSREVPGKMDAVIFAPKHLLKPGSNDIVLRLSGHRGYLKLAAPMHNLSIYPYTNPTHLILDHYWRSFLPLGVLLLGLIYFGVLALRRRPRGRHFLLPLMSMIAAVQLCVEVSRGLVAYAYPWHDIRLLAILLCSFGFGLSLLAHVLNTLEAKQPIKWIGLALLVCVILINVIPGFDYKSVAAFAVPCGFALFAAIVKSFTRQPGALFVTACISVFMLTVVMAPSDFLDIYFFYLVAALILLLFIQQSSALTREREEKAIEKARGDKLQLIVDQNRLSSGNPTLSVKSAGKTELVAISDLIYCQGAGDYVELVLKTGANLLHNDNLAELEHVLPATFIRVHRSYIVNTAEILSIERKSSGTGILSLSNGQSIPVSRRTMPSVRERLIH